MIQLTLFNEDTDCGCSSVARPVSADSGRFIQGETFEPIHDELRLGRQALAVMRVMKDGEWRTLREIVEAIGGGSEAGVSARLRDFRKAAYGSHVVNRRRRGDESKGVFEYQVVFIQG